MGRRRHSGNYKNRHPLRYRPAPLLPPLSVRHHAFSQWRPSQGKRAPGSGCASGKPCSLHKGSGQLTWRAESSLVPELPCFPLSR